MTKLEKAATKIMAVIGTSVLLFLLFYSWKYTKRLVEPECYLDEADSILVNALLSAALLAVCAGLWKGMQKVPSKVLHLLAVISAVAAAVFGIRLVEAAGAISTSDQYYIQRAAMALADGDAEWVLSDGQPDRRKNMAEGLKRIVSSIGIGKKQKQKETGKTA